MHQQDDEVDHVVPGQEVGEACACGKQQQLHKKLSQQIYTDECEEPITLWSCAANELTAGQGPGQSHEEVSHIVGMANHAPPAGHKQTFPRGRRDGLQICSRAAQDTDNNLKQQSTTSADSPSSRLRAPLLETGHQGHSSTKGAPNMGQGCKTVTFRCSAACLRVLLRDNEHNNNGGLTSQIGSCWISPEGVLLRVGLPEDVEADS